MSTLPFGPYSATLKDVLREKYIKSVTLWLLGGEEACILAQKSGSAWESALSIILFADVLDLLSGSVDDQKIASDIRHRSASVANWLRSKIRKVTIQGNEHVCWEEVTWDTAVCIRALMVALNKYPGEFTDDQKEESRKYVIKGVVWLISVFREWDSEVKYPFGPADIAQIVITLVYLKRNNRDFYNEVASALDSARGDPIKEIVEYLIHIKTDKSITVRTNKTDKENVVTCWWDDYFSTSEVIEALGVFHHFEMENPPRSDDDEKLLHGVKTAIINACTYFELNQVDGTWGSHIDTLKVIYAYVSLRRLVPSTTITRDDDLIVPEIHTTFKALRWICDCKQVFSDGSFMHTTFLTVFYALAIVEVHKSWEPAGQTIENLYDDVVWASPMRTTPERRKRLVTELKNTRLKKKVAAVRASRTRLVKAVVISGFVLLLFLLFLLIGKMAGILDFNVHFAFIALTAVSLAYVVASVSISIGLINALSHLDFSRIGFTEDKGETYETNGNAHRWRMGTWWHDLRHIKPR